MFGPIRAVIIDDIPSHLYAISAGVSSAGIPCSTYWYDRSEIAFKNKLKPSPPEGGHKFIRIIFTDLNLEEHPASDGVAEALGPVIKVIEKMVKKGAGPYAIIFWTGTKYGIDEIREELYQRLESIGVPEPVVVDELNKGPFLSTPSHELTGEEVLVDLYKNTHNKIDGLDEEIYRKIEEYGLLLMIAEWESRAIHAAGITSNSIFEAANIHQANTAGGDLLGSLRDIMALVACETAGNASASDNPAKAYDAAMMDMLFDSFNKSVNNSKYSGIAKNEIGPRIKKARKTIRDVHVLAHLNTMFHIDSDPDDATIGKRGVVVGLEQAKKASISIDVNDFCCWDDYFWEPRRESVSISTPQITSDIEKAIISNSNSGEREGLKLVKELFLKAKQARNTELKDAYDEIRKMRSYFSESIRWVLLEIGADCDYAQRKSRTYRYLVGAEIPEKFVKDFVLGGTNGRLRNDALKLLGPYNDDGEIFYLLFSVKRYAVWQAPEEMPCISGQYRLRNNIVDYLLNKYATWSMRPGIVEY